MFLIFLKYRYKTHFMAGTKIIQKNKTQSIAKQSITFHTNYCILSKVCSFYQNTLFTLYLKIKKQLSLVR